MPFECYFCGSNTKEIGDRYFIDKEDNKSMCKICGTHYIQRQFFDSLGHDEEALQKNLLAFIEKRFEKVMI